MMTEGNYSIKFMIHTDNGVSLFKITWSKWGGNIGGPDGFSHGLTWGISWEYSAEKKK